MNHIKMAALVFLIFLLPLHALAHPGKSDYQGGHTDHSTGVYHYHHGYPAHFHTNGECPYDFKDKTGQQSGSSSSGVSGFQFPSVTASPAPTKAPAKAKNNPTDYKALTLGIGTGMALCSIFRTFAKSKEKRP